MTMVTHTVEEVKSICAEANGIADALRKLGYEGISGTLYRQFKKYCQNHNIPIPEWTHPKTGHKDTTDPFREGSGCSRANLKSLLLSREIMENKCDICDLPPEWQGKPLSLHLDHINGVYNDNRLENLRFLCPNCHNQTDTFGGKRLKKPDKLCPGCGQKVNAKSKKCWKCYNRDRVTDYSTYKIDWPPTSKLIEMVAESSYVQVAEKLGVSDNALRKRIKRHPDA